MLTLNLIKTAQKLICNAVSFSKSCCSVHSISSNKIFNISSVLYSNRLTVTEHAWGDLSTLHEAVSRVNYKITLHIFFLFCFSLASVRQNQMQNEKNQFLLITYNTRLSWKSLQQCRISLQHMILLQKLTVKIEVTQVTAKISWELVNPVNLFSNYCSNSMQGVVSVYYGNIIAEAGLGLQLLFVRRYCAHCVWHSAPLLPQKWVLSLPLNLQRMRCPHSCSPLSWRT